MSNIGLFHLRGGGAESSKFTLTTAALYDYFVHKGAAIIYSRGSVHSANRVGVQKCQYTETEGGGIMQMSK